MAQEVPAQARAFVPAATLPPRVRRRNFYALLWDYLGFGIAFNMLNPRGLPPEFVAQLGGGAVLIGLAGLIYFVAWMLPQMFFAPRINRAERKKPLILWAGIPARMAFWPAALLIVLAGPDQPGLLITLLLGSYVLMAVGDGFSAVAWMDVVGSSLDNGGRGWLFGVGEALVGLTVAVIASPLVRLILGPEGPPFPNNYALLLALASGVLVTSLLAYGTLREGDSPPPPDTPTLREYGPFLKRVLREDAGFRRYLIMRLVYDLGTIALPFYIVYATQTLGQESGIALSDQVFLMTAAAALAALVFGRINQRRGPRMVILIGTAAALAGPLCMLTAPALGALSLHVTWITLGVVGAAFVPGQMNWVVEYAPQGFRPIYSGVANAVGAVARLAPLVGGLIVAALGHEVLFTVAVVLGVAALALALRLPHTR
ncbi:MAG: MFS transporter, partial [Anaerolineae bacterium]|nr:MFS transporter [Anaerolineae bacterium]